MQKAVIVYVIRSLIGRTKAGSALTEFHATELLVQVLKGLVERSRLDPGLVDDVITGCMTRAGEQSAGPGRVAWLVVGFPEHVPATIIERL